MSCNSCLEKISQFTTKKHPRNSGKDEKWTQTTHKPFLVDLLEERVQEICHQNRKLSKMVLEKEADLMDRQT